MCLWRDYRVSFWEQLISSFPIFPISLLSFHSSSHHLQSSAAFFFLTAATENHSDIMQSFPFFNSLMVSFIQSISFPLIGLYILLRLCFCLMDLLSVSLQECFGLKLRSRAVVTGCRRTFNQWQIISAEWSLPQLAFNLLGNHWSEKKLWLFNAKTCTNKTESEDAKKKNNWNYSVHSSCFFTFCQLGPHFFLCFDRIPCDKSTQNSPYIPYEAIYCRNPFCYNSLE